MDHEWGEGGFVSLMAACVKCWSLRPSQGRHDDHELGDLESTSVAVLWSTPLPLMLP